MRRFHMSANSCLSWFKWISGFLIFKTMPTLKMSGPELDCTFHEKVQQRIKANSYREHFWRVFCWAFSHTGLIRFYFNQGFNFRQLLKNNRPSYCAILFATSNLTEAQKADSDHVLLCFKSAIYDLHSEECTSLFKMFTNTASPT